MNVMRWLVLAITLVNSATVSAQVRVKGSVYDREGNTLPLAHIFVSPDSVTTSANNEGEYTVRVKPGAKVIHVSYVGYDPVELRVVVRSDTTLKIIMQHSVSQLHEVVISGERDYQEENFTRNRTSTHVLTNKQISAIPVLGGEADVIKTLQLLPGTVKGVEGTSDLFVRGGAADQNLVLLDGAPVYNTAHLFGFLSVFNPDILQKVEAVNGGFPARYGGRLSSILDVESRSELATGTHLSGDIGLIASRIALDQPIVKDKASFWVAGRRTYIDQVVKAVGEDLPYFFYDLNARLILKPTPRDQVMIGHYAGQDILDWFRDRNNDGDGITTTFRSGNSTQSLVWKHAMRRNTAVETRLFRTKYLYDVRNSFEENELVALSDIEDYGARLQFSRDSIGRSGAVTAGLDFVRHTLSPNVVNTAGAFAEIIEASAVRGRVATEAAAFAEYSWSPTPAIDLNVGARVSSGIVTAKKYIFPEPRFAVRVALNEGEALKFSYSRMVQFIHRISNSAVTSPTDIWFPVTDSIAPQTSHQVAVAWQKRLSKHDAYISAEAYYKSMENLIGYEEGTNLFFNTDFESRLIQGDGRAWGLELLLRKDAGRFTGWLSYSLSWSHRRFDEVNNGDWYRARYDRRHNGAIVMQYGLSSRWSVSAVWEFISGARFTPVVGQYGFLAPSLCGFDLIPVYTDINSVKLSDAHRLDVGIKFRAKPGKRYQWSWFAGVYNVYNRTNPVGINIVEDETDGSLRYEQPGLFGLLPFISYGFKL